ncbi:MAG TPA: hypothetical protein PLI43_07255 [Albidovulum sp.]|uniref:hypothetical protein n=1 Tax=Albidovulum sp. TaxID=1872424 RepID=UPI002B9C5BA9|nr:hypothetical protein [Albidovulum sp.]
MLGTIHRLTILLALSLCLALTLLPGPMVAAPAGTMAMARDCAACPVRSDAPLRCGADRAVLPVASAPARPLPGIGTAIATSPVSVLRPQHEDRLPTRPA